MRDNILTITNNAYISKSEDDIGREIPLSSIDEWKNLPATISYAGLEKPDFGYYRNPIKNEIDRSPCGVSIFESGIDQLESVDVQNARLKWEFESGERAINVSTTALQPIVGEEGRLETPKTGQASVQRTESGCRRRWRSVQKNGRQSSEISASSMA